MQDCNVGDLEAVYAWPEGRWVRAMMLHSLDGAAAGPDGRSGSISSPADRRVLAEVRRLADAVVIGAETMRVERYSPMRAKPEAAEARAAAGLAVSPVLVIVSESLDLPWDEPVFTESASTPIVICGSGADHRARRRASEHAELVVMDGPEITASALLDVLTARGLRRIVCEGGWRLLRMLIEADAVDELDFTIAPWLIGRPSESVALPVPAPHRFIPVSMMVDEGFAFMRYRRAGTGAARP